MIGSELSGCGDIDIIQNIHIEMPKINIIALFSSEKIEEGIYYIRAGAKGYISKNSSTESFLKIISLIADGDVIISPPLATKLLEEFTLLEKYEKDTAKIEDSKKLSKREQEVLSLVAQGFSNKEIAEALFISEQTVKTHMRNVMAKLHLHNRMRAIIAARATQPFPNDKNQVEN
jgi:two-component system NarL family response regulator